MPQRGFRENLHYFFCAVWKSTEKIFLFCFGWSQYLLQTRSYFISSLEALICLWPPHCTPKMLSWCTWVSWRLQSLHVEDAMWEVGILKQPFRESLGHCWLSGRVARAEALLGWEALLPVMLPRLSYQDCVFPEQTSLIISYLVQGATHPNQRCCLDSHWLVWVSQFKEKLQKQRQK